MPSGECASCVFGAYKAVYHLSQDPSGSAPQFTDASGSANFGFQKGAYWFYLRDLSIER